MVFSGILFLYFFLPLLLIAYFLAPDRVKNTVLLIFSLLFYAAGEPRTILLMLFSVTQAYGFALLMGKSRHRKAILSFSVILSLLPLLVFKYADFAAANLSRLPGVSLPLLHLRLPIGISFYTFQLIGYSADVYRGDSPVQRRWDRLALYVALFPQLIAGPIVRYRDVEKALTDRRHTLEGFAAGILRFSVGLGKKVMIANVLGELCGKLGASLLGTWVFMLAASLQIYFDFSGYSDMAVGLGRMFGFSFPENFDYPYISRSISEFWRRWHRSLGTWFRDYIYIPLGGNRVKPWKWVRNVLIVWMLTGLWHGAAWTFVLWGLYFAVFLMLEKAMGANLEKIPLPLRHTGVLLLVGVSFLLFDAPDVPSALETISRLWDFRHPADPASVYALRSYILTLAAAVLGATPLPTRWIRKLSEKRKDPGAAAVPIFTAAVLLISTAYLVDGSFNPFLYFRF